MEKLVSDMRSEVDKSSYSCAFGMLMGHSAADMLKEADKLIQHHWKKYMTVRITR